MTKVPHGMRPGRPLCAKGDSAEVPDAACRRRWRWGCAEYAQDCHISVKRYHWFGSFFRAYLNAGCGSFAMRLLQKSLMAFLLPLSNGRDVFLRKTAPAVLHSGLCSAAALTKPTPTRHGKDLKPQKGRKKEFL